MPITQMQHYMVLSKDLEKTRHFYCDVLGMRTGPRPPFDFEGLWIYVGDVAVVHVAGQASYEETGRLDRGGEGTSWQRQRRPHRIRRQQLRRAGRELQQHGVKYRATQVPDSDLRQLFVLDPDGIQIEINIRANASG